MKMQILELGLLILAAYIGGLVARKIKIGEVIGQILGGMVVGPHFLELIHHFLEKSSALHHLAILKPIYYFYKTEFSEYGQVLESYHFFVFLFLGLIAFSLGEELHRERLKKVGSSAIIICFIQGILTFLFLAFGFKFIFQFNWINSLLLGSIGIATAPALTFILMTKLNISGSLRNILANIVVLDDIIEVVFFSTFFGIAIALQNGKEFSVLHLTYHVGKELFLAAFIGFVIFVIFKFTVKEKTDEDLLDFNDGNSLLFTVLSEHPTPSVEILLILIGTIAVGIAVAIQFNLPFLITAVVAGLLVSNFHNNAIFESLKIENVMPIFNLMFFAIIGASVRIDSFSKESLIFVLGYVVLRSTGKIFGNWLGAKITNQDPKIVAALPKLMLPQAGMAAVETILVATVLRKSGGLIIFNTIIPALIIFELGGAYLSEKTLLKWKNWIVGEKEALKAKRADSEFTLPAMLEDRVFEMMASTQEQAFFELAQTMVKRKIITETSEITFALSEREILGSTYIGKGIAIPHCRIPEIDYPHLACGLLNNSIDWKSPTGEKVNLLFLILTPENKPEQHLKAVRAIAAEIQKHEDLYQDIKTAMVNGKLGTLFSE
jgi:mannitol/fructose-specific phosphotransferase system IIA component (Ntr-type)/Kef-type K+ transport system membrane component KefB